MTEIEPVAYLSKYLDNSTNITRYKPENKRLLSSNPLYTAEQLHPRVKMTRAEFDKWENLYERFHGKKFRLVLEEIEENNEYLDFDKRFLWDAGTVSVLANLFDKYEKNNPEKTIEILPEKKWFVREKDTKEDFYLFLSGSELENFGYLEKEYAITFDTKEEAEKWVNPLCEAVLLPVEE